MPRSASSDAKAGLGPKLLHAARPKSGPSCFPWILRTIVSCAMQDFLTLPGSASKAPDLWRSFPTRLLALAAKVNKWVKAQAEEQRENLAAGKTKAGTSLGGSYSQG